MRKRKLSGRNTRLTLTLFVIIALGTSEGNGQEAWIGEALDAPGYEWFVAMKGSGQATGAPDAGVYLLPPESSHDGEDALLLRATASADAGRPVVWAEVSMIATVNVAQASVCSFWLRTEREAMRFPVQTWYQTPNMKDFTGLYANWTNNIWTAQNLPAGDNTIEFGVSASAFADFVTPNEPYPPNGTNFASVSLYLDKFAVEPMPSLSISDASVIEGDVGLTSLMFTVMLSHAVSFDVVANLVLSNGVGCVQGEAGDYLKPLDQVHVPAGATSVPVVVSVVGDTHYEADEQLWVFLTEPYHATLADAEGLGTIINDDPPRPHVKIQAISEYLTLSWGASNGWAYTLQSTASLLPPVAWSNCAPYVDLPGSGNTHSVSVAPNPGPMRFFRVRVTELSP